MPSYYTFKLVMNRNKTFRSKILALIRILKLKVFFWLFPEGSLITRFHERSRLIIERGFNNSIGNYYVGLLEPDEMSFLLRFLRSDDLFVDAGANVGSYTILASANCGARTITFEPVPTTFEMLKKNVSINSIDQNVILHNVGLGAINGSLAFTSSKGGKNHVVLDATGSVEDQVTVPIVTLDDIVREPVRMLKIDVEGFELQVLTGARAILANPELKVVLIEINGLENRYGITGNSVHDRLIESGFSPYTYIIEMNQLVPLNSFASHNTLYIRDLPFVYGRIQDAKRSDNVNKI